VVAYLAVLREVSQRARSLREQLNALLRISWSELPGVQHAGWQRVIRGIGARPAGSATRCVRNGRVGNGIDIDSRTVRSTAESGDYAGLRRCQTRTLVEKLPVAVAIPLS
jgi:hypothetical protein